MKIILHAGVHKTGSSSIQAALHDPVNRPILRRHGIGIPETLPANQSQFFVSAFGSFPERYHTNLRNGLDRNAIQKRTRAEIGRMREALTAWDCQTVLFSGEDISTLHEPELGRLHEALLQWFGDDADIRIIMYTRHPVSFVESAIQQNVKGNAMTIAQSCSWHVKTCESKYRSLCERFEAAFGIGALELFSFEEATAGDRSVMTHFGEAVSSGLRLREAERRNLAVCDEVIRFLSSCHEAGYPILPEESRLLSSLPGARGTLLSAAERREIAAISTDDRSFLRQKRGIDYRDDPAEKRRHRGDSAREFERAARALAGSLRPETRNRLQDFIAQKT